MPAYSAKAQPYLEAISASFFIDPAIRDWIIKGTPAELEYAGAEVLIDEQRSVRWKGKPTKQPFWANYWCGRDSRCTCRIDDSKGLEPDAIFFLRNRFDRTLAVHIEFKHRKEAFQYGQAEAYPLRATCFVRTCGERSTLNAHHDWTTVLFCDSESLSDQRLVHFHRVITHAEAAAMIEGYPAL